KVKLYETEWLLNQGVDEIDMVINISALKSKDYKYVEQEIKEISKIFNNLKVIIETCLLTDEEKIIACEIIKNNGAKFVKTSTGFSKYGATLFDVALLRAVIGNELGVKASGGIRDKISAIKMILAGANRIGTSSAI
ncbi:MAG: deoxyribose-phosphate aldolase, partial [candidate division WOR-3 bacterium]